MDKMFVGLQIFLMCAGIALIFFLVKLAMETLFRKMDKKYGNYEDYVNPKKWPEREKRTIKRTLYYMGGNVLLLVWDIMQGGFAFAAVLTVLCVEGVDIGAFFKALLQALIYALVVHCLILFYYRKKDYTIKMFKCTEKYLGTVNRESFQGHLENDLQNHMLLHSRMWILTQNFIMGWGETETAFHPIAIPRTEIVRVKSRVSNKWFGYGKRSICPVIMCELRNGKTVEIFAGNRFQIPVLHKLLIHFMGEQYDNS